MFEFDAAIDARNRAALRNRVAEGLASFGPTKAQSKYVTQAVAYHMLREYAQQAHRTIIDLERQVYLLEQRLAERA